MTVLTRIIAAAAVASIAFADIAGASAAENYAIAAQRARARHNERAAHINAVGGEIKKRGNQKRCKPATTSTFTSSAHASTSPAQQHPTTTVHHNDAPKTTSKAPATTKKAEDPPKDDPPKNDNPPKSNGKVWIASGASPSQIDKFTNGVNVGGVYNWGPSPPKVDGALQCVMLWGNKNVDTFRENRGSAKCLMGFNEFNLESQSGLSTGQAIDMWNKEIKPYTGGKMVIAPSVTTATDGLDVLNDFFNGCGGPKGCGATHTSAHVYDKDPQKVIDYVTTMHTKFGLPVVLSEFGCQKFYGDDRDCDAGEAQNFISKVMAFCESTSWVTGCAAFGVMTDTGNVNPVNRLINSDGSPTYLGKLFLGTA